VATEKQYLFFKALYDEERLREASLADRAKTYLSLITFYSAFVLFATEHLKPDIVSLRLILGCTIIALIAGFLLSLWSIRVSNYEATSDPRKILHGFRPPPEDDEFFDHRIVDFTVAYERNRLVNDEKARQLSLAGYMLLIGIFLHTGYFFLKMS
jgi:hypothetical protein